MPTTIPPPDIERRPRRSEEDDGGTVGVRPMVAASSVPAAEAMTTGTTGPAARTVPDSVSSPIASDSSSPSAPSSSSSSGSSASSPSRATPATLTPTTTLHQPLAARRRPAGSLAQHRRPAAQLAHRGDRTPPHVPPHRRHGGVVRPRQAYLASRTSLAAGNRGARLAISHRSSLAWHQLTLQRSRFRPPAMRATPSTSSPAPTPSIS